MTKPNLHIHNLHFSYKSDVEVLKGLDLHLGEQTTAIIGQNGAGKSTFVKLLKGLLKPTMGEIQLNDMQFNELTAAHLAKYIGLVFQNPNDQIFKHKVIDEVMFGPLNIGKSEEEAKENALQALQAVELADSLEKNPYDLSLSERKMVAIASILAMKTEVVIFDEPTMGQDYQGKERIKTIINQLHKKGKLVICILHDMDFVAETFERTIVLNQGEVLLDGDTREVFSHKEILLQAMLEQPQVTQIANHLGYDQTFLTEEELIKAWSL
jgi:energy-coupling factor transport system ATP-binding protein